MARDRKRAKQRQRRSAARSAAGRASAPDERAQEREEGAGRPSDGEGLAEGGAAHIVRADLPGALDHMGDVDEFDAALVRGAGGVPASPDSLPEEIETDPEVSPPPAEEALANGASSAPARARASTTRAPAEGRQRLPSRALAFLRASWAELQRVQWPNRSQVTQATAVVLGFVAVAGVYFGLADYIAKEVVEAIL
ncbi:MAG: preprotein translocase subunit SecE [Solirubrobacterales bacterium]